MRKEFEKLPDIAMVLKENPDIKFEDGNYIYHGLDEVTALATMFVFGAYYAFQEQQKRIDMVKSGFSQGGYVKKGECSLVGGVMPAEHYFIRDNVSQSELEKINNLSEKMNTTITVFSDGTIAKTGD